MSVVWPREEGAPLTDSQLRQSGKVRFKFNALLLRVFMTKRAAHK